MYRTETSVKNRQEGLAYVKDKQCLREGSGIQSACNHSPCEQSPGGDHTKLNGAWEGWAIRKFIRFSGPIKYNESCCYLIKNITFSRIDPLHVYNLCWLHEDHRSGKLVTVQ